MPCPATCKAHFDAWADPRRHYEHTGDAYTPLPNSILAWVSLLPGTTQIESWKHKQDSPGALIVNLYRNESTFFDGDLAVPVWVVTSVGVTEGAHYCALFDNESDARTFYRAEVDALEELLADG